MQGICEDTADNMEIQGNTQVTGGIQDREIMVIRKIQLKAYILHLKA